jgi:PhzF family phenazine biosynthesis protein
MRLIQVDAFTDQPFRGNPAAVCLLDGDRGDDWMQSVAAEMNLAETAFLRRRDDGWSLRWFTPVSEVDLCGHATLASAHFLWEERILDYSAEARFHTRSGLLTASRDGEWIELDFPATPPAPADAPPGLVESLGVKPVYVGRTKFDYLVEVASEDQVRAVKPNFSELKKIAGRGAMVTSRSANHDYDFVSRYFAPAFGIDEDPVTGSTHCALVPFWGQRLGKSELVAYQASARGGLLRLRQKGDRVRLGGRAITVLRGELTV